MQTVLTIHTDQMCALDPTLKATHQDELQSAHYWSVTIVTKVRTDVLPW